MRILTVRQPWAWAIIHANKDVERLRLEPPPLISADEWATQAFDFGSLVSSTERKES